MSLIDLLQQKKCFKLVCGAGNEDPKEVEKLVAIYSKAGCRFFDVAAKKEILEAAKKGLSFSVPKQEQSDYHFCVSVGMTSDPHFHKAKIFEQGCIDCGACTKSCPQRAIHKNLHYFVSQQNCVGCGVCEKVCNYGAIELISVRADISSRLKELISQGVSCIEVHAMGEDDSELEALWNQVNDVYDGFISISLGRKYLSDNTMIKRIKKLIDNRKPYSTMIQADGLPISGSVDDFSSTLQAVACAQIVQQAKLDTYVVLSGGTNSKTTKLARQCDVDFDGVAIGSYARKIVRSYLQKDDLLENSKHFEDAVKIASELVEKSI